MIDVYFIEFYAIVIGILIAYLCIELNPPQDEGAICPFGMEPNDKIQNTFFDLLQGMIAQCQDITITDHAYNPCVYKSKSSVITSDMFKEKQFQNMWKNCLLAPYDVFQIVTDDDAQVNLKLENTECNIGPTRGLKFVTIRRSRLIRYLFHTNNIVCKRFNY